MTEETCERCKRPMALDEAHLLRPDRHECLAVRAIVYLDSTGQPLPVGRLDVLSVIPWH